MNRLTVLSVAGAVVGVLLIVTVLSGGASRSTPPANGVAGLPDSVIAYEGLILQPPQRTDHQITEQTARDVASRGRAVAGSGLFHVTRRGLPIPNCDCWIAALEPGELMGPPVAPALLPTDYPLERTAWAYVVVDADTGLIVMTSSGSRLPS